MDAEDSSKKDEKSLEGTHVDLGEDLLVQTPEWSDGSASAPLSLAEEVANADILFNEQLFEDAKKILRKVLRHSPNNLRAREILEAIQKKELQDLLAVGEQRGVLRSNSLKNQERESADQIITALEEDLRLHLDKMDVRAVPDLFSDSVAESRYIQMVLDIVPSLSPRDTIDWGIAFFEMGLFKVARALFEEVIKFEEFKVTGMYLLGLALIGGDQAIEATIRLEPVVRDLAMHEDLKVDFLYLMGTAFEQLNDQIKAKEFYRRVWTLNPRYRDVVEKIR